MGNPIINDQMMLSNVPSTICVLILWFVACGTVSTLSSSGATLEVNIDLKQVLSVTEDEYLSFCLDPYLKHDLPKPWGTLNFTHPRLHTLAKGLAPAILRFGGTDADWSVFYNVTNRDEQANIWHVTNKTVQGHTFIVPLFPQDIDHLHGIAKSAGGKLLFDLNIQQRFGQQWDPTNAFQLMRYIEEQGYAKDMDFELGNEPSLYPGIKIDGKRIGQDFLILRSLLDQLPAYSGSRLVGPDVSIEVGGRQFQIAADFATTVKNNVSALTCHFYYFRGPGANVSQYYDVKYFDKFEARIQIWKGIVRNATGNDIDLWVGETSDSFNKGTPNITNRYLSGFLWLDKLGIAARNGFKLVARQDFFGGNYPLISDTLYPNPDYWLSQLFKQLVGKKVLKVGTNLSQINGTMFRVYGHCTSSRSNYLEGSITLYLVNINKNTTSFSIDSTVYGDVADIFLMTPDGTNLQSPYVKLNGVRLEMVDDSTLPNLKPVEISLTNKLNWPGLTYGFLVLKAAKADICKM